jgi:hypothetical protein
VDLLHVLIVNQVFLLIQEVQAVLVNLVEKTLGFTSVDIVKIVNIKMKLDLDPVENVTQLLHLDRLVQKLVAVLKDFKNL